MACSGQEAGPLGSQLGRTPSPRALHDHGMGASRQHALSKPAGFLAST